jgi:hypothetical protein
MRYRTSPGRDVEADLARGTSWVSASLVALVVCAAVQIATRNSDAVAAQVAWIGATVAGAAALVVITAPRFGRSRMITLFGVCAALAIVTRLAHL